jgi:hypothetical protein
VLLAQLGIDTLGLQGRRHQLVAELAGMYGNVAQAAVWVGAFVLLRAARRVQPVLRKLVPYGLMSCAVFVLQCAFARWRATRTDLSNGYGVRPRCARCKYRCGG